MSTSPEVNAKTLTQLVATEIKVQMARADVRQSQLARKIGKNEQWLSVRLRGRQPFDVNDLLLIARALDVGVHDLLPPPEAAILANIGQYLSQADGTISPPRRPRDNRPSGHPAIRTTTGVRRTSVLPRPRRPRAA